MIRKIMVVLLVTVMLFCSCSVDKEPAANNASDVSSDFYTSRSAASNTSSGNIPSGGSSETAQKTTYEITGQQFYTHTVSQFLKWCKSGGSEKVNSGDDRNYSKYDCNKPFLQVVNDSKTLLVPIIKNSDYKLSKIKVEINQPYFKSSIKTPDGYLNIISYHPSLFAGYEDASIPKIIETLTKNGMNVKEEADEKITEGAKNIKWGEYYYVSNGIKHMTFTDTLTNSSYDEDLDYIASYFKVEDFLVKIVRFGETEWDDNYFDYFDYERISW